MKTIFVQIASYRDTELPFTIHSCLSTARHPERIRFGICWQYDEKTELDLENYQNDARFRIDKIHYSESKGCCWARNRTNRLYQDESYTLQIDAHMRFSQGWDERMIEMLESIEHDKPLLTTYPPPYLLKDGGVELKMNHGIQKLKLKQLRLNLTTEQETELVEQTEKPGKSKLLAAGYIFTLGQFCREVEYDPNFYFHGEEISLAVRAYTHGYNLYYPHEDLIWHRYRHDLPEHWTDHKSVSQELERKAFERLEILLMGDHSQLGKYGLGNIRTLKQFEDYANIRFSEVTERRAKTGGSRLEKVNKLNAGKNTEKIFIALAAYCEPELRLTIKNCLERAVSPDRLRFGVCLQYDNDGVDEIHDDCIDDMVAEYKIRLVKYPFTSSKGGCWARNIVQSLYRHEEYTLQIDAHSRFVDGWDDILINMMKELPSKKPLITGFPPLYFINDGLEEFTSADDLSRVPTTKVVSWSDEGWIHHPTESIAENTGVPRRTRVLSGAFVFTIGRWNLEVNQDPDQLYTGEEFALALRSYTAGYDLFNPTQIVVWHRGHPEPNRKYIHDFDQERVGQRHAEAVRRLQILLAGDTQQELVPFSLGRERTLDDYHVFSGLDCKNYHIHDDARDGVPPDPVTLLDEYMATDQYAADAAGKLLDLTIQLAGMEALELQCEPASPIVGELIDALQANINRKEGDADPMMYLQFSDDEDHEIYFLQSRLLSLQTRASGQMQA